MSKKLYIIVVLLGIGILTALIMASQSGTPQKNTLSGGLNLDQGNNQLLGTDASNFVRLLVQANSNGFNMRIAKDGYDARTASDSNLIFNSDNNVFKIVATGTASITPASSISGGTKTTATVAHNLGFKPAYLAYVTNPDLTGVGYISPGLTTIPSTIYITDSGACILVSTARVDEINIYFDLTYLAGGFGAATGLNAYTWNYKYYLLQETAQ